MPIGDLHKKKRNKNLTVLTIIVGICVLIWAITVVKIKSADAAEIVECGAATTYEIETQSPVNACDIYTRQLAYRDEALKLREQIKERSTNFAKPIRTLKKQYDKDLEALHDTITEENIPSIFPTEDE